VLSRVLAVSQIEPARATLCQPAYIETAAAVWIFIRRLPIC